MEWGVPSSSGQLQDFFINMELTSTVQATEEVFFHVELLDLTMFYPRRLIETSTLFSLKAFTQVNPELVEELEFIE